MLHARLARALAARGLEKRPGDAARVCRVAPRLDGQAEGVARVTALYQQARFDATSLPGSWIERSSR
jgi:hypothetical protein